MCRRGSSARSGRREKAVRRRFGLKKDRELEAMRRALELAWRGWGRVSPNPLVGAFVLRGDQAVAQGCPAEFGGPRADPAALPPPAPTCPRATPLPPPHPRPPLP